MSGAKTRSRSDREHPSGGAEGQKLIRCDDGDVSKRIEHQEVGVPRHDVPGAAAHRQFEEFVVFRVPARLDVLRGLDEIRSLKERPEECIALFELQIAVKFLRRRTSLSSPRAGREVRIRPWARERWNA